MTKENKVLLTTAIVVDVELGEEGHSARIEEIVRRLTDAVGQAFAGDPSVESLGGVAFDWLNDADTNFGRCMDCKRLVSDHQKPNPIRLLMDARMINGRLLCDECTYFRPEETSSAE